jgi:hypothetical protein
MAAFCSFPFPLIQLCQLSSFDKILSDFEMAMPQVIRNMMSSFFSYLLNTAKLLKVLELS